MITRVTSHFLDRMDFYVKKKLIGNVAFSLILKIPKHLIRAVKSEIFLFAIYDTACSVFVSSVRNFYNQFYFFACVYVCSGSGCVGVCVLGCVGFRGICVGWACVCFFSSFFQSTV